MQLAQPAQQSGRFAALMAAIGRPDWAVIELWLLTGKEFCYQMARSMVLLVDVVDEIELLHPLRRQPPRRRAGCSTGQQADGHQGHGRGAAAQHRRQAEQHADADDHGRHPQGLEPRQRLQCKHEDSGLSCSAGGKNGRIGSAEQAETLSTCCTSLNLVRLPY